VVVLSVLVDCVGAAFQFPFGLAHGIRAWLSLDGFYWFGDIPLPLASFFKSREFIRS
jgi:hypothetical protein